VARQAGPQVSPTCTRRQSLERYARATIRVMNRPGWHGAMTRRARGVSSRSIRSRLLAVAATGAVALAAPVAGASAQIWPSFSFPPIGGAAVSGNQIGTAGCVGTNRPSLGGNNGSTSAETCGSLLAFTGPQIGQISSVIGPTMIGTPGSIVIVSAGSVTGVVP
jgi:hypothetical protein